MSEGPVSEWCERAKHRVHRFIRLVEMDAPQQVIDGEVKLIEKALKQMTAMDLVAFAGTWQAFVEERIRERIEWMQDERIEWMQDEEDARHKRLAPLLWLVKPTEK